MSELVKAYRADGRGGAAHDPSMMAGLLLAYCTGVVSSRKIEAACQVDVAFRVIAGNLSPGSHRPIARFRATHADALAGLFTQVLAMSRRGWSRSARSRSMWDEDLRVQASLDANRTREAIMKQVEELIAAAEAADAGEDMSGGVRGDEVPADLRDRTSRRARLAAAKARLDAADAARQGRVRRTPRRARGEGAGGGEARWDATQAPGGEGTEDEPAESEHDRPRVTDDADPERVGAGLQRDDWSQIIIACDVTQDTWRHRPAHR